MNVSVLVLSSRSLQRIEASSLLSFPGMAITIVTKLQLEFLLGLVKKFCAIGGFRDLATLCLVRILARMCMWRSQALYFQLQE